MAHNECFRPNTVEINMQQAASRCRSSPPNRPRGLLFSGARDTKLTRLDKPMPLALWCKVTQLALARTVIVPKIRAFIACHASGGGARSPVRQPRLGYTSPCPVDRDRLSITPALRAEESGPAGRMQPRHGRRKNDDMSSRRNLQFRTAGNTTSLRPSCVSRKWNRIQSWPSRPVVQ